MDNNQQNQNQDEVIFREGGLRISQKIQMGGRPPEESTDRIVSLIRKISGGRIKSKKTATFIVLFLVTVMFIVSVVWFIQALSGPKKPAASQAAPSLSI